MKKLIVVLLAVLLMSGVAFANQRQVELTDETLSKTNTDTGWLTRFVENSDKVTFFVTMDSSSTTTAVTAEVTAQGSVDGTNWTDLKWYDIAGGTTAQVTETLSKDGTYIMWLDRDVSIPHVRVKVVTQASAKWPADTAGIIVTIVENK